MQTMPSRSQRASRPSFSLVGPAVAEEAGDGDVRGEVEGVIVPLKIHCVGSSE
jgi:hypothetical protein